MGVLRVTRWYLLKLVTGFRDLDDLTRPELSTLALFLSLLGFIKSYFDSLYDEEIITEESFNAWESSYEEETGKGLAIGASSEFFRWLRSAAEEPGGRELTFAPIAR